MIPSIKKILYASDLTKNSAFAFRYAINSAKKHNAEIVILHVMEEMEKNIRDALLTYLGQDYLETRMKENIEQTKGRIQNRLKVFYDKLRAEDPDVTGTKISIEVCQGYPAEQILRKADELDCDAIIMGTHGKGFISQTFLGSVAKRVLRRTRKPVFIIPLPREESDLTFHDI